MKHAAALMFIAFLPAVAGQSALAQESYREQMQGLDEQVQEVKSDVLGIAAELRVLEEKLLYPSDTHLALFVQLAKGDSLRLDAVQIQINGELAAHYIYSFKELEALQMGGVQRIYTGNIATGEHQLAVTVSGKLPSGKDYSRTDQFSFTKEISPKLIGVTVAGPDAGQPIALGNW